MPAVVTASTVNSTPARRTTDAISGTGLSTPVLVSPCTTATMLTPSTCAPRLPDRSARPAGPSRGRTRAPYRAAISAMRRPKLPLAHTKTVSPASTRLAKPASIPRLPVPASSAVNASGAVPYITRRSAWISAFRANTSGSMWPSMGRVSAS
jgi:hypothetical protein